MLRRYEYINRRSSSGRSVKRKTSISGVFVVVSLSLDDIHSSSPDCSDFERRVPDERLEVFDFMAEKFFRDLVIGRVLAYLEA